MRQIAFIQPVKAENITLSHRVNQLASDAVICKSSVNVNTEEDHTETLDCYTAYKVPKKAKRDFILPPISNKCTYGITGMESVECSITAEDIKPTHKITSNGNVWYRVADRLAKQTTKEVTKITDTHNLRWNVHVDDPEAFVIRFDSIRTDRTDEDTFSLWAQHAENNEPFTLCLVNNSDYNAGLLHVSTTTIPETEVEISESVVDMSKLGLPFFLINTSERTKLVKDLDNPYYVAYVILSNGERLPLYVARMLSQVDDYVLYPSDCSGEYGIKESETFYKMLRYGFSHVESGDHVVQCRAFMSKGKPATIRDIRGLSANQMYEIKPEALSSANTTQLSVLEHVEQAFFWTDALVVRETPEEIPFSEEEQAKIYDVTSNRIDRFSYPNETIEEPYSSYKGNAGIRVKKVAYYVGNYNYVRNSSVEGMEMEDEHIKERTWYKIFREGKETVKDWVKAVEFEQVTTLSE